MKKLVIVATVALAAICTQAAQFKWSAMQVKDGYNSGTDGYTAANISGVTAYLIMSGDLSQSDFIAGAKNKTYTSANIGTYAASSKAVASGNIAATTFDYDTAVSVGGQETAYFVIFSSDGGYFYTSAEKSADVVATGSSTMSFGLQSTSNTLGAGSAGSWTAVPEPTSGLLVLLGMAGLALRRRRA